MLEDIPQPVLEHFGELRRRVVRVLIAAAAAFVAVSMIPTLESSLAVRFFRMATASLLPPGTSLVFLDPLEPLWVALKSAGALTAALVGPYALYQAASFLAPAFEERSRRLLVVCCAAAAGLFALGAAVAWTVMIPMGLKLFMAVGAAAGATPALASDRFFGFVLGMIVVCAVPFELPLALALLMRAGVITPAWLREYRRPAYVAILVLAAVITPDPTPVSQLILSAILVFFYELAALAGPLLVQSSVDAASPGGSLTCPTSE